MRMIAAALLIGASLLPLSRQAQAQPINSPQSPVMGPKRPDPKAAVTDMLLEKLKEAPNEAAAHVLEETIRQRWIEAGSPATTLLMSRGLRNLQNEAADEAVGDFDAVLALEPDLHAAFGFRARAKFLSGDYPGALRDTQAALQREPRNFIALQSLSRIAEARGDLKGALLAWQKALEIDPMTPDGEKRLRELNRKVNGETT